MNRFVAAGGVLSLLVRRLTNLDIQLSRGREIITTILIINIRSRK